MSITGPLTEAGRRLLAATRTPHHQFWPDRISLLDPERVRPDHVYGPRQITDAYLLALAVENGGRFVTFDARIPLKLCPNARPDHLLQL